MQEQPQPPTNTGRPPIRRKLTMGDCVFFKSIRLGTRRKDQEIQFKGHGFGIYLGAVPVFGKEPTPEQLFMGMGHIGFLTFDDVAEFLGDKAGEEVVNKFTAKYYKAEATAPEAEAPLIPQPPTLVDVNGAPVESEK
jgi:hypothetical protein